MNTPKIRFKGFTDDWEQRKFKELCDMVTVGIANSATHAYSDSGVVMFRNQNIKPNFLDDTDIIHINSEFEVKYKNKRLKKNDLLVARTGYPGTACVVPEKYENSQTFTTLIARPNENVDPYFLCQYLNSDIGIKYFESTQIGGGQKNSGAGILNEMPVTLPSTIEEEKKIGDYFRILDHLITLHQRKCDETKQLKKFMLQKMFPKNGEKNPEIRFEGFTDDWEQRKLSELTTMHARIGWQNLRTSEFLDSGDYMLITGTDFQDGVIDYSTCHYVEKERYDQDKNIQIQNGSILITKDGTLGKVAYVQGLMMPTTLNAGVFNVTIKNENIMDGKYLFQYLKAPFLMDYVSKKATGGTIKHLNQSILVDFPVEMPKTEEQVKISRYFTALDHLITLHQRKCEKLKELKKFMLQNMFV